MLMLSGVSIVCFASSYAVALLLEVARLFSRFGIRMVTMIAFVAAGLVAHTVYLAMQAQAGIDARGAPLSNWYHWCLVAAWVLAAAYLALAVTRPKNPVGLFLLPLVLALIGVAQLFPKNQLFPTEQAHAVWSMIHGMALLFGTASVIFGFAAGVMYLIQSYRLKHKLRVRERFQLPSLEWLQRTSERVFLVSSFPLVGGVLSGFVLNVIAGGGANDALPLTDPVIWTSTILLLWLIVASLFNWLYKPARQGRKVAYLTIANFIIVALVLGMVLSGRTEHASTSPSHVHIRPDQPAKARQAGREQPVVRRSHSFCRHQNNGRARLLMELAKSDSRAGGVR
jgi:ABC-type uncharacterized transport system permease subunit